MSDGDLQAHAAIITVPLLAHALRTPDTVHEHMYNILCIRACCSNMMWEYMHIMHDVVAWCGIT